MSAARRLAIFVPSMKGGGAERVMATLAAGFARRGHAVDLVLARAEGVYLGTIPPGVRIVDLDCNGVLASLPGLVRYLRRERPAALLSAIVHANVIALIANRLAGAGTRLVISERSSWVGMVDNLRSARDRAVYFIARRIYRWADAAIVVATAMIEEHERVFGVPESRIHMIPNPVVSPALVAAAAERPDHRFFGQGAPVIVAAGRLTAEKDFETLIRAFARLRAGREARLLILGEGKDRRALEALAAGLGVGGDVAMPGFSANPFPAMRAASLFVLSSRFEGMPGALIQAMACGAPVVATDCLTGPREILEDGRWGALVPVGDDAALADAMAAALDSGDRPDVRQRAADFDEDKSVDRYLEILLTDRR